ncbi:hypothetical protein ACJIZ3_001599 [Penstemon smallii]|uniref:Lachrymatory factor synthase n=1 Tax=Penstemon smallii TaxID=265156 RepID=A0ABD3U5H1_9LAMI
MAAAQTENKPKWEGKIAAKVEKTTPQQAWTLLEDFCNIHKWLPSIDTCHKVEGVEGRAGLVRYCASTYSGGDGGDVVVKWCNEKLIEVDPINKCLSYEVLENNMGLKFYKSTMEVKPTEGGDDVHGCLIEWSFLADPVEGFSFEDLIGYLDLSLQGMVHKMEKTIFESL